MEIDEYDEFNGYEWAGVFWEDEREQQLHELEELRQDDEISDDEEAFMLGYESAA